MPTVPVYLISDGDTDGGHLPVSPVVAAWSFGGRNEDHEPEWCAMCERGVCVRRYVADIEGDHWILHGTWEA